MADAITIPFIDGEKKDESLVGRFFRRFQMEGETPKLLNASDAFIKTTYGETKSEDELINEWRSSVVRQIDTTMNNMLMHQTAYNTLVVVPSDMMEFRDRMFQPFVDGGYRVYNMGSHIDGFPKDNVFLVSWEKNS